MSPYRAREYWGGFGPRAFAPDAPPPFYFANFIRLLDVRRKLITHVTLGAILFVLAVALLLPTTYASSSVVMTPAAGGPAAVQNQIWIITSHDFAAMVADQLNLADDPEFNPRLDQTSLSGTLREMASLLDPRNWFEALSPASIALNRERMIETLQHHMAAGAEGLSTSITITATSRDPAKAALIANTIADVYVKSQAADKINVTSAMTGWPSKSLSDLSRQLQLQQAAVQRYKAEHNLNDSSIVDQEMAGINAQIVTARSELAEKQAISERIHQLVASGNAADVAQIVASPLIVQLRAQRAALLAQEGELNSKYGPLHPKMQAIQEQRSDVDFKISQEVSRLAASAVNDVMVARAHLNSLQASLGGTENIARSQNMARAQLQALEFNANSTRNMYEAFVQRPRQNSDERPESRIISSAAMPLRPAGPKRLLMLSASVPLGLILGVLTALIAENLAPPVKMDGVPRATLVPHRRATTVPMTMLSGPPVLGEINGTAALAAADYVLDYPASKYAKAIARLVRELEAKSGDGAIIALTSADDGENRSAIAVSLARAAARMGKKTVILDCAPLPLSSRAMRVAAKTGLYEVLSGSAILSQALAKDPRSKAYLLAVPRWPGNAANMFASRAMARLIAVLRGGADFVVIDCGPIESEASAVMHLADATVLVARRQTLHSPLIAKATRHLQNSQAAPAGLVITS